MSTTYEDRIDGITTSAAIKVPVRCATTANITLSGLQTIDGVTVVADDRVLVKDQTTATQNGIYRASSTAWSRADDFDGNRDIVNGTVVRVRSGTRYAAKWFTCTATDPITIDTTSISFSEVTSDTSDGGRFINVRDEGATGDGSTDDSTVIEAIFAGLAAGDTVYFGPGTFILASGSIASYIDIPVNNVRILGAGRERTTIQLSGTTETGIFGALDKSGLTVEGIHFVGNNVSTGHGTGGSAVYVALTVSATADITDFKIKDCSATSFKGAGWFIFRNLNATYNISRVGIENPRCYGGADRNPTSLTTAANQIYMEAETGGYIEDVTISRADCEATSVKTGITFQGYVRRGKVDQPIVRNAGQGQGAGVAGAYGINLYDTNSYIEVLNPQCLNCYTAGIYTLDLADSVITNPLLTDQDETVITTLDRAGLVLTHPLNVTVVGGNAIGCYRGLIVRAGQDDGVDISGFKAVDCTYGMTLRAHASTNYRGGSFTGLDLEGTATALEFYVGGATWFGARLSDLRLKGAAGMTGSGDFEETVIDGYTIYATANGIVGNGSTLASSEFGDKTNWLNGTIYGDLTGHAVDILDAAADGIIKNLTIHDITTGTGWRVQYSATSGLLAEGVSFNGVTTPTAAASGNYDVGIEDPATTWSANLPENGAFTQKFTPTISQCRSLIGWMLVAGSWREVWVRSGQSAFQAIATGGQSNIATGATIQFNSETFDDAADYNNSSYTFTARYTARHQFNVLVKLNSIDTASSLVTVELVTSNRTYGLWATNPSTAYTADTDMTGGGSVVADMDAGDTAYVIVEFTSGANQIDIGNSASYFSGGIF